MEKEIKRENACFPSFDMIMGFPSRCRNEITMDTGDEDEIKKRSDEGKRKKKKKKGKVRDEGEKEKDRREKI